MKRIAITIGDPNGIGPEVALKAVARRRWPKDLRFVLVGCERLIREQARAMELAVPQRLEFLDVDVRAAWHPGKIRADASRLAAAAILRAVDGCLSGEFDAMVTAPICKEGFHKAGIEVPGHTELLAERTGCKRFAMLLVGGGLRVAVGAPSPPRHRGC